MEGLISMEWEPSFWHWLILAGVLGVIEITTTTTFLIGPTVAAVLLGLLQWAFPGLDWRVQVLIFSVLSVVLTVALRAYYKKKPIHTDDPSLNLRLEQMKGRRLTLDEDLANGQGRTRLDDTSWAVATEDHQDLTAGTAVEIVGYRGTVLLVRPVG